MSDLAKHDRAKRLSVMISQAYDSGKPLTLSFAKEMYIPNV